MKLESNAAFASAFQSPERCSNEIRLPEYLDQNSRRYFSTSSITAFENVQPFQCKANPKLACAQLTIHLATIPNGSGHDHFGRPRLLLTVDRKGSENSHQAFAISAILDNTMAVIYTKDRDGRYQLINRRFEQLFEISMEDILGKTDFDVFPREQAIKFHQNDIAVLKKNSATEFEEVAPHDDGLHTYISLKFPIRDHSGSVIGVCGISTDITERRKLEDEIARISSRETNWISRELHDSVGQQLTGLAYLAKTLVQRKSDDNEHSKLPETLLRGIQSALTETRRIVKGMSPVEFDALGLCLALEELAKHIRTTFQIECEFSSDVQTKVYDNELALQWYRIAQEATNNAIKHGRPTRLAISLNRHDCDLVMQIQDDGCGMKSASDDGMGLRIMRHRSNMVAADLEISSSENGTKVICRAKR